MSGTLWSAWLDWQDAEALSLVALLLMMVAWVGMDLWGRRKK